MSSNLAVLQPLGWKRIFPISAPPFLNYAAFLVNDELTKRMVLSYFPADIDSILFIVKGLCWRLRPFFLDSPFIFLMWITLYFSLFGMVPPRC
jgi:hypothetical protein